MQEEKGRLSFQTKPGFTEDEAYQEALRCLHCRNAPCQKACPLKVDIPGFINAIKERDPEVAMMIIKDRHPLPAVCGYACPSSKFCEGNCVLGKKERAVSIAGLKRFVADWQFANNLNAQRWAKPRDIAIIGAGPAGLTAAYELVKLGHRATILEATNSIGGLLRNILPDFRLPRELVDMEVQLVKRYGVRIETGEILGKNVTLDDLKRIYDAVLITGGPYKDKKLNLPGENLLGVYSGMDLLKKAKKVSLDDLTKLTVGEEIAVIGGGDVSVDVARLALRLGAKRSMLIYRKGPEEISARSEEVEDALEEGVEFIYWHTLTEIKGKNGKVAALVADTPEGEKTILVDEVYKAIGYIPYAAGFGIPELKLTDKGLIDVSSPDGQTSIPGVFAAGDLVTGASTITEAMASGKKASWGIHKYLSDN